MVLASLTQKDLFTYADYLTWPDDERWELINGIAYNMSPAPSRRHQQIAWELTRQLSAFLLNKECEAYFAPFDVRLPETGEADEKIFTVVQPDILVVCDLAKLDDRGCKGAPDFIVEILSPSTAGKDLTIKATLYERHGVKEYWAIHPTDNLLYVRLLGEDGKYNTLEIYEGKGDREVAVLPGLTIELNEIFGVREEK